MAMTPDGGLLLLGSSVYRKRGLMFRFKELHGNNDADDICWLAAANVMNPRLPQSVIDRALREDPAKASSEYLSIWRSDLSDFLPFDVIDAAVDYGTRERAPEPGIKYVGFVDAAGGTGSDSFACAVAHSENSGKVVLDCLRVFPPPFVPAIVIGQLAELLRSYNGSRRVFGDRWAGGFHSSEWQRNGITYVPCNTTTSENYLSVLPLLLAGRVRLVENRLLHEQLASLERRAHATGHETVSHPQTASAHDDAATAAVGALVIAQRPKRDLRVYAMHPDGAQLVQDGARTVSGITPETVLVRGPDGQLRLIGCDNTRRVGRGLF